MWAMLCASVIVMALSAFVPAYLLVRAFGIGRIIALASAPLVSSSVFSLQCIVYAKVGIPASWSTVVLPFALAGIAAMALRLLRGKGMPKPADNLGMRLSPAHCALFAAASAIACLLFYILPMGNPQALICGNDIVHHISLNRAFVETGNWSTLETATTPGDPGAFYPSLWNLFAALPMSAIGADPLTAAHAANIFLVALVFPLSSYLLAARLFEGRPFAICMAGVLSFAFFGFPWEMFLRPTLLYPNALGFALMPAFLACLMMCFENGMGRASRAKACGLAFAGFCAIGLAHPNSLFTAAVFAFAFLLHRIVLWAGKHWGTTAARAAAGTAFSACAAAAWIALSCAPFMQAVAGNPYNAGTDIFFFGGLARIAILKSPHLGIQAVLAALVAVGFLSVLRKPERRWLALPFAIMAALYSLSISLEPGTLKSLLTGFWYNHPTRVFASATMFAMPLAAEGAETVATAARRAFDHVLRKAGRKAEGDREAARKADGPRPAGITPFQAGVGAVICACAFALPLPLPRAMTVTDVIGEMRAFYNPDGRTAFFTQEERSFMQRVEDVLPEGSRVLNMPNDGSGFAYALYGTNVSGRDFYNSPTCPSALGSQAAGRVAAGSASARELADLGFTHVVVLDPTGERDRTIYKNRYDEGQWAGMLALNEKTPGLDPVLVQDGMVLYEVES